MPKKKIAVLAGGWSPERDISLLSGQSVIDALSSSNNYELSFVDCTKDIPKLIDNLSPKPDLVFIALHGEGGEDGVIQGILEALSIPYTHSGVLASAMGMNKAKLKEFIQTENISTPAHIVASPKKIKESPPLPFPFIIKPVSQGSSVGVYIIKNQEDLDAFDADSWVFGAAMAEEYIPGRELSASVILDKPYPVVELNPKQGFYSYEAKYTEGKTDHYLPARIPDCITKQAQETALKVHKLLGCKSVSRTDFRYDDTRKDSLQFLEINTHPGFTPLSILPEAAQFEGVNFPALCKMIIEDALT